MTAPVSEPLAPTPPSFQPPPMAIPPTPPPMSALQMPRSEPPAPMVPPNAIVIPLGTTIQDAEKSLILRTLEYVGGNKQKAARVLGISRRCLYNRLEEYGVMKASAEAAPEEEGAAPEAEAEA
jgi:DNA-binding NtrC family response regulator